MEVQSAVDIVNTQMIYVPGWEFTAEPFTDRFEAAMQVRVNYPVIRTDREVMRAGEVVPFTATAAFPIVCDFNDMVGLARCIIDNVLVPIHLHEAREGLRFLPTFWAPFHPHRVDGMNRWGDPNGDLMFGIV